MAKNKGGNGSKSPDSRRNSPRIAIAPSCIAKIDAIVAVSGESRADFLEKLIDREFRAFIATTTEQELEKAGLIE